MRTGNLGLPENKTNKQKQSTNPMHIVSCPRERRQSKCTQNAFSYLSQTSVISTVGGVARKRCEVTEVWTLHLDSTSRASQDRSVPSTERRDCTSNAMHTIKAYPSSLKYIYFDCLHSPSEGFS